MNASVLPRHVAIIMDGNGRWARERGLPRYEGHAKGAVAVRAAVETAARLGVPYLTLYAFSVANWKRPRIEVEALMRLLGRFAKQERAELLRQNIRVQVIGHIDDLPSSTRNAVQSLIAATAHCTGTTLSLALSYGGRQDLVEAAQRLARRAVQGALRPEDITEDALRAELTTSALPDVDLLIRTGGESRISDFLLFECAYAELLFVRTMWPDFTAELFEQTLRQFSAKERRFGLTSEQLAAGERHQSPTNRPPALALQEAL